MRKRLIIALVFLSSIATAAPLCRAEIDHGKRFGLGLAFQTLLPNQLVDFDTNVFAYGPFGLLPLGPGALEISGLYGFNAGITLYTLETGYRITVSTPFITGFAMAGGHFLHYALEGRNHDNFGANFGLGVFQGIADNFGANLYMKVYVQERSILSFGGSFTLLL